MSSSTPTYQDVVEQLARDHAESDASIKEIWTFPDPAEKVVRFIEVSDAELPAENGHVVAVRFGPSRDFPLASEVALLTHEDWNRVRRGELSLPAGWDLQASRKVLG